MDMDQAVIGMMVPHHETADETSLCAWRGCVGGGPGV